MQKKFSFWGLFFPGLWVILFYGNRTLCSGQNVGWELMQLHSLRGIVRLGLLWLFGLCATDGICQTRGLQFLGPVMQNLATGVFFLLAAAALLLAWREKDRRAMGRIRLWAGMVLLLSVVLLVLLWVALMAELPALWVKVFIHALAVVSTPVTSCSVLFWPIFCWTLMLVVSWRLCRIMDKRPKN